jgi:hypothetical protein
MRPVVSAATLALGRAAFGLRSVAVENIGSGVQDDGAGSLRANSAITQMASNQAIHAANHLYVYAASNAITFTLDRANTLFNGFSIKVFALTNAITFTPNANDNFSDQASGTSLVIPKGSVATLSTDGAKTYRQIAITIFGEKKVTEEWRSHSQFLKDRTRRLVAKGTELMRGGYRDLLT